MPFFRIWFCDYTIFTTSHLTLPSLFCCFPLNQLEIYENISVWRMLRTRAKMFLLRTTYEAFIAMIQHQRIKLLEICMPLYLAALPCALYKLYYIHSTYLQRITTVHVQHMNVIQKKKMHFNVRIKYAFISYYLQFYVFGQFDMFSIRYLLYISNIRMMMLIERRAAYFECDNHIFFI